MVAQRGSRRVAALRSLLPAALLLVPCACGPMDCYMPEDNGLTYRGLVDFSMSGRPCVKWTESSISPTARNGIGNHRYCRNPDQSADSPWCFVQGRALNEVNREPCHVDVCDDELRDFEAEAEALDIYMGSHNCDCGAGLLEQDRRSSARGLRSAALLPDGPPAAGNASGTVSALRVRELLAACLRDAGRRPPANGTDQAVGLWREGRRRCGLTEVLARRCHCAPRATPDATTPTTAQSAAVTV